MREEFKKIKEKYKWVQDLEGLGYTQKDIIQMMIMEEKRKGNLIGIINLLELEEKNK